MSEYQMIKTFSFLEWMQKLDWLKHKKMLGSIKIGETIQKSQKQFWTKKI